MNDPNFPENHNVGWLGRAVWLMCAAQTALFMTCLHMTLGGKFKFIRFDRLVNFNSAEPFQHRVLLPAIVAGIEHFLPLGNRLLFAALEFAAWVALIWLAYRALVMFRVGSSEFMRRVLAFSVVIPMFVQLILPDLQIGGIFAHGAHGLTLADWKFSKLLYYPYDLPAAVFTLALSLIMFRQLKKPSNAGFAGYLILFAVATVNRETTVFLLPFFALLFWRRITANQWLVMMVLQVAILAAIQMPLHWLFEGVHNPKADVGNTAYENHLIENLTFFSTPLYVLMFLSRFTAGFYLPVLIWWRHLDWRLTRALIGFALPLFVFAMIMGRLQEHRIFIEFVPLVWMAGMQVLAVRSALALEAENSPASDVSAPAHDLADTATARLARISSDKPHRDEPSTTPAVTRSGRARATG